MQLGIIGLPQSGKTTLYKALTRANIPTEISAGHLEVHTAVIDVPDPRVEKLIEIFIPKKHVYAKVTYTDIAGLDGSAGKNGIAGALLNRLSQMDGFIHVVRHFENSRVPHILEKIDPLRDIIAMDTEFILSDLIIVERKLEHLADEHSKGVGRDRNLIEQEIRLFERLRAELSAEKPLRDETFTAEEEKMISGYGFLSHKPQIVVINQSEVQEPWDINPNHQRTLVVCMPAKLEMDIAELPNEDAALFMAEYGIEEPGLNRLIKLSYDLLGLQSFFTASEKEVHAWTLKHGLTAHDAAGVIHSDMEKGFIRAEVVAYDDLVKLGSMTEARAKGKLRLEGKDYIVADGDILVIRFNI
ncbi:MAG: redox-regulated ATPase YchF [Chloroflexota bacterium]